MKVEDTRIILKNKLIIHFSRVQQNAKRISKLWHDRPQNVMDSAIYWTEYVARHDSAPLALPTQHRTWFENLQLDVSVTLFLLLSSLVSFCYVILKLFVLFLAKLYKLFCTKKLKKN